jgi:tetratricopeptide (TPR) repeat protein
MAVIMMTVILLSTLVSVGAIAPQAPPPVQSAPGPVQIVLPAFAAPTREFVPPLGAELAALRTGAQLYDKGEYDKAAEVFERVLAETPNSPGALYELALVHLARKDYQKAVDTAARLTQIRTPDLAKVYALIGNTLDMAGDPKKAVDVYRKGIEFSTEGVGTLYFNLGITYVEGLKDPAAAKAAFKQGALVDPTHTSTQLMLSKMFLRDDLRTPGLLAIGRFLILEPASTRIQEAYTLWYGVLKGNMAPDGKGGMTVKVNPAQSKEEGDLTQLDLHITLSRINAMAAAEKTEIQKMVLQVDSLLGVYASTPAAKDATTFLGTYYMPFFLEMRAKGFVEPFVYYISQRTPFPGVREWLTANQEKVEAFLSWSRTYQWPTAR